MLCKIPERPFIKIQIHEQNLLLIKGKHSSGDHHVARNLKCRSWCSSQSMCVERVQYFKRNASVHLLGNVPNTVFHEKSQLDVIGLLIR